MSTIFIIIKNSYNDHLSIKAFLTTLSKIQSPPLIPSLSVPLYTFSSAFVIIQYYLIFLLLMSVFLKNIYFVCFIHRYILNTHTMPVHYPLNNNFYIMRYATRQDYEAVSLNIGRQNLLFY